MCLCSGWSLFLSVFACFWVARVWLKWAFVLVGACSFLYSLASEWLGFDSNGPLFWLELVPLCIRLLLSGSGLTQMGLCSGWSLFLSVFSSFWMLGFGSNGPLFWLELVPLCIRLLLSGSGLTQMDLCSGWSLFVAVLACFWVAWVRLKCVFVLVGACLLLFSPASEWLGYGSNEPLFWLELVSLCICMLLSETILSFNLTVLKRSMKVSSQWLYLTHLCSSFVKPCSKHFILVRLPFRPWKTLNIYFEKNERFTGKSFALRRMKSSSHRVNGQIIFKKLFREFSPTFQSTTRNYKNIWGFAALTWVLFLLLLGVWSCTVSILDVYVSSSSTGNM
jgi:hypothetical protein